MRDIPKRKKMRTAMWRMFSSNQWFMMPKVLMRLVRPMDAFVLAYLINVGDTVSTLERKDKMFWVKNADICKTFNITEELCRTCMRSLETKGYIKTKMKGIPAKRYVKINMGRIMREAAEFLDDDIQPDYEVQT